MRIFQHYHLSTEHFPQTTEQRFNQRSRLSEGPRTNNRDCGSHAQSTQPRTDTQTTSVTYTHTTKMLCWLRQQTRLQSLGGDKQQSCFAVIRGFLCALAFLWTTLKWCSHFPFNASSTLARSVFGQHLHEPRIIVEYM